MSEKIDSLRKILSQREQVLLQREQATQPLKEAVTHATNKLSTLEQYLTEYAFTDIDISIEDKGIKEAPAQSGGEAIQLLLNRQNFTEQIKAAITQQKTIVEQAQQQYALEEAKCIQQRIACKQIESLMEKKLLEEATALKQLEQKQSDEIALQFTQRRY